MWASYAVKPEKKKRPAKKESGTKIVFYTPCALATLFKSEVFSQKKPLWWKANGAAIRWSMFSVTL